MDPLVQTTNHKYCLLILHRENQLQPWKVHNNRSVILREQHVNCNLKLSPKRRQQTVFKATILDGN